jgi:hypothetical protein
MDAGLQLMNSVVTICQFLAAFPALWISGRIILRNDAGDNPTTQLFLWLALGGLILTPLADFLRYLGSLFSLIISSFRDSNPITIFLGVGPFWTFSTITLILGIVVYGLAYYYARRMIAQGEIPLIRALQLENWELGFALLGVVGLINQMVKGIAFGFVSINLPDLTAQQSLTQLLKGFWASWLIAFLVLLVTLFVINERISKSE